MRKAFFAIAALFVLLPTSVGLGSGITVYLAYDAGHSINVYGGTQISTGESFVAAYALANQFQQEVGSGSEWFANIGPLAAGDYTVSAWLDYRDAQGVLQETSFAYPQNPVTVAP